MTLYLVIVFLLLVNVFLEKKIWFFSLTILVFLLGLRAKSVGVDTEIYWESFYNEIPYYTYGELLKKMEPSWIFLNKLLKNYNFQYLLMFCSIVSVIPVYFVCKKASLYPSFSFLLYVTLFYYFISFSLIRQFIAIPFFMLATYFYINKKYIYIIFFSLFSIGFHYSTLAVLPIIFLTKENQFIERNIGLILTVTIILGYTSFFGLSTNIFSYIPFEKYANYETYRSDDITNKVNMYAFLIPQNLMCYLLFFRTKPTKYSYIFFSGIVLSNLFLTFPLFSRLAYFLLIFEIIAIPNLIAQVTNKQHKSLLYILVFTYIVLYFGYYIISNRAKILPYEFFTF